MFSKASLNLPNFHGACFLSSIAIQRKVIIAIFVVQNTPRKRKWSKIAGLALCFHTFLAAGTFRKIACGAKAMKRNKQN